MLEMNVPEKRYRNPLGSMQPDTEAVKRNGWQREHILVIAEDDGRLDALEREIIQRIGERLYGEYRHG